MYEFAASSEMILLPGAARSGLALLSYFVGPRDEYVVTSSSSREAVPNVLVAPTVIAYGELPGDAMPPRTGVPSANFPAFPAAVMTMIPARYARSTAAQSGSNRTGSVTAWPSDRFMILMLYFALLLITQSMPAMTSLVLPTPSSPSTRTLITCAPGAMPPVYCVVTPAAYVPVPVMIPATCVPCPYSSVVGSPAIMLTLARILPVNAL